MANELVHLVQSTDRENVSPMLLWILQYDNNIISFNNWIKHDENWKQTQYNTVGEESLLNVQSERQSVKNKTPSKEHEIEQRNSTLNKARAVILIKMLSKLIVFLNGLIFFHKEWRAESISVIKNTRFCFKKKRI